MKLSVNWLNKYLSQPVTAEEAEEILTQVGLEVEGVETYESIRGGLKGLIVGKVVEKAKHPDADRLSVTQVDVGNGELLQVVCGAPNVEAGQKVVLATPGTLLYSGKEAFEIKKSKIRGVESNGMICAEDEIGVGTSHDGIIILPEHLEIGQPVSGFYQVETDTILEINITPNRADATSHIGCARDVAAYLSCRGENVTVVLPEIVQQDFPSGTPVQVSVANNEDCPRYSGIVISGLTVKESPVWLKQRLESLGLKPVNNIVDITNFVMYETGQPLHAFDLDQVKGRQVTVKKLRENTPFVTLEGTQRKLSADDLMICDAEEGLCIAGVFGGMNSGVSASTTAIFLESAYFNPSLVRKTARRHGLHTDAGFRFERGTDPNITVYALQRAVDLILEIAGGKPDGALIDLYPSPIKHPEISLGFDQVRQVTGIEIPVPTILSILEKLDIRILQQDETGLKLQPPTFKPDVTRAVDVIEEILRIYGFDKIPITGSLHAHLKFEPVDKKEQAHEKLRRQLLAQGFMEAITLSFNHSLDYETLDTLDRSLLIEVKNPISNELDIMRSSLAFNLFRVAAHNINRKEQNLKMFESGRIYTKTGNPEYPFRETHKVGLLMAGNDREENWHQKPVKSDFYHLKAAVEMVLQSANLSYKPVAVAEDRYVFQEAFEFTAFAKDKEVLACLGSVHPKILKAFDIKQPVWYAEIDWDMVLKKLPKTHTVVKELPKFPAVKRDLALLIDSTLRYEELEQVAYQVDKKLLKAVNLFDVFEGKNLPQGKKSYALSFIFRAEDRTLTDQEIERLVEKLVQTFKDKFGAELRA